MRFNFTTILNFIENWVAPLICGAIIIFMLITAAGVCWYADKYYVPNTLYTYEEQNPFESDMYIYITDKKDKYVQYVAYTDSLPGNYNDSTNISKRYKHSAKVIEMIQFTKVELNNLSK